MNNCLVYTLILLDFCAFLTLAQRSCKEGGCGSGRCVQEPPSKRARCHCDKGWMGANCAYPCQDVYKSCKTRWEGEKRCIWAKSTTLFFDDNCAATCGVCEVDQKTVLPVPLPPLLEPLTWLVGQWETESQSPLRYPASLKGSYKETLIFHQAEVTMFDRPVLNFTATAVSNGDPTDVTMDMGFVTSRFSFEDTGFRKSNKSREELKEIGLEMNSNTGLNTLEEGTMVGNAITLNTTWIRAYEPSRKLIFKSALRTYKLTDNFLEETGSMEMPNGETREWSKFFTKTQNFLRP